MRRRLVSFSGLALLATACGVNEGNFTEQAANVQCRYVERCYLGEFVDNWDSMSECVEDTIDETEDFYEKLNDECDFDREKADKCIDGYRAATRSCDDSDLELDDCIAIWDDC